MLTALTLLLLTGPAAGRDAVELQVVDKAQEGFGSPSLTVVAHVSGQVDLSMRCSGRTYRLDERVSPGTTWPLALEGLGLGHHPCTGTLSLAADDGTVGEMPLSFQVHVLPPIVLSVAHEDLDLEGHSLVLQASRPLARVTLEVYDDTGQQAGSADLEVPGLERVEVPWVASGDGEVLKIVVVAEDMDQMRSGLELLPWHYAIPHEDVVFESGQWAVLPEEAPKLEAAWTDLQEVLARYGSIVEVKLFVAGYTDTVGGPDSNLVLSRSRARAIAAWFRARGFTGPVAYQGFGEQVLAVPTPDETDERANRRALYVLAAESPPVSDDLPRADWSRLP